MKFYCWPFCVEEGGGLDFTFALASFTLKRYWPPCWVSILTSTLPSLYGLLTRIDFS